MHLTGELFGIIINDRFSVFDCYGKVTGFVSSWDWELRSVVLQLAKINFQGLDSHVYSFL